MKSQKCSDGFGNQCPPDERHVKVYFLQQGSTIKNATAFFDQYKAKMWKNANGHCSGNWKKLAWSWIHYRT